ncbi:MAG: hypothetical protein ACREOI_08645 [bacterium]
MNALTDKEISAFHTRFCPFADRLYRSALIVTGSPRSAEQLQVDVYLKAFVEYLQAGNIANFKNWLAEIVSECFSEYELENSKMPFEMNAVYRVYQVTLKKLIDCKKEKLHYESLFTA